MTVRLEEHLGEEVTIEGKVSRLVQAHVMTYPPGKHPSYVDVPGWGQVVCYVKEKLRDDEEVRLTGVVLSAGGGPPGSKAADFVEYQLDVSRWERVRPA